MAERLHDMDSTDLIDAGEIGDCSRDAEHAVKATGGQVHRGRCIGEQLLSRLIWQRLRRFPQRAETR